MKYLFPLIFILLGWAKKQTDTNQNEFGRLIKFLPPISTPITLNSDEELNWSVERSKDESVHDSIFKKITGFNAVGKIFETNEFTAVIGVVPADIATPVLMTFDQNGERIDSLWMYPTAAGDIGFYCTNVMTIDSQMNLTLTDSTLTRKLNQESTDEISGSDFLTVSRKKYKITEQGKIVEFL